MRSISFLLLFLAVTWLNSNVVAATYTVTNTADAGAGSLRQALADAKIQGGSHTIVFAPALSGHVIRLATQLVVNEPSGVTIQVTIDATALPGGLTISGDHRTPVFHNAGFLTLLGLTISDADTFGALGKGGAIYNTGTCVLTGCFLYGNSVFSGDGGAIYNAGGEVTLTGCTIHGNSASRGGAIYNDGGKMALRQSTLSGNRGGGSGGAIYNHSASDLILTQCTFADNRVSIGEGGAIYHFTGTAKLTHCTLAENGASYGGAIFHLGSLLLHNCIVATNSAPASNGPDIYRYDAASLTSSGVNVIGKNGTVSSVFPVGLPNAQGNYVGTSFTPLNPQFAPWGDYGGPTRTLALLPGSVARDHAAVLSPALTSDQRGFPIVGTPDVGAYEAGTTNTFSVWALETFGSALSFAEDNDRDGHANGLEYATRTNPAAGNISPLATPIRNAAGATEIRFPYRPGATDVRYVVLRSPDLKTWTEIYRYDTRTGVIEEFGITADENAATQIITITDPVDTDQSFWTLRTDLLP